MRYTKFISGQIVRLCRKQPPVIEVNFLKAVYPSGQINLSSWKYSESLTIFPVTKVCQNRKKKLLRPNNHKKRYYQYNSYTFIVVCSKITLRWNNVDLKFKPKNNGNNVSKVYCLNMSSHSSKQHIISVSPFFGVWVRLKWKRPCPQ